MFDELVKRWEALAEKDPRLEGTINGLASALASLEEEHGVSERDPLSNTMVPPLREPPPATETLRRPAGW
jgi:hypothetical protein